MHWDPGSDCQEKYPEAYLATSSKESIDASVDG